MVVGNDGVGRIQNGLRRAVVLLQPDEARALILVFKIQDVLDRRAAEAIDALVIVTDDADILVPAGQQRGQQILQVVRILILVDEDIAELALIVVAHILIFLQQADRQQDDVIKIHGVRLLQPSLVGRVELADALQAVIRVDGGQKLLRRLHLVLQAGDLREDGARRECLLVQPALAKEVLHHALGIRGVVDRKTAVIAEALDLAPQDAAAGRVERHGPDVVRLRAEQVCQAFAQLICRLVREGDGQNAPRRCRAQGTEGIRPLHALLRLVFCLLLQKIDVLRHGIRRNLRAVGGAAITDQIGDAVDENGRLAAAGAGQQQERPLRGQNSLELTRIHARKARGDIISACGAKALLQFLCHNYSLSRSPRRIGCRAKWFILVFTLIF